MAESLKESLLPEGSKFDDQLKDKTQRSSSINERDSDYLGYIYIFIAIFTISLA